VKWRRFTRNKIEEQNAIEGEKDLTLLAPWLSLSGAVTKKRISRRVTLWRRKRWDYYVELCQDRTRGGKNHQSSALEQTAGSKKQEEFISQKGGDQNTPKKKGNH